MVSVCRMHECVYPELCLWGCALLGHVCGRVSAAVSMPMHLPSWACRGRPEPGKGGSGAGRCCGRRWTHATVTPRAPQRGCGARASEVPGPGTASGALPAPWPRRPWGPHARAGRMEGRLGLWVVPAPPVTWADSYHGPGHPPSRQTPATQAPEPRGSSAGPSQPGSRGKARVCPRI